MVFSFGDGDGVYFDVVVYGGVVVEMDGEIIVEVEVEFVEFEVVGVGDMEVKVRVVCYGEERNLDIVYVLDFNGVLVGVVVYVDGIVIFKDFV